MYYNSIIDTIGNTPLVKLNKINKGISGTILVKVEYFNPGNSMKDRMAIKMIEDAEKAGILKPGGTIIEGTSGNTGMGLALVAISKGYKCIFTLADKQSKEKMDILRAMGAEVIVCPTNVSPEDSRSYYSIAKKLNQEIPNSFYPNQYDNTSNAVAHYETTGPEIWEQTDGKITHWAAGVGTGGSMCGTSKYLKEQNPKVISVGIDSYGSVFKKYKETGIFDEKEIYPYLTEGIGEDILPKNVDFSLIDHFVKVTDKDGAIMTRRLAREEGLFCGWSCGSAVHGALEYAKENMKEDDVMVIILPDHGTRYLGKIYNDDWMRDHGFLENNEYATAKDIIAKRNGSFKLISVNSDTKVGEVVKLLDELSISQLPVQENGHFVGSISDTKLLNKLVEKPELKNKPVSEIMDDSFKFIAMNTTVDTISSMMNRGDKALMVMDEQQTPHIITKQDLLMAFSD
ncbi:cystathionine beta-synthase [Marivirga sp. S37H4]|uniref:Cystathionine beta-synthase n=1 Tax=Marivirga aurantiaca TaxID=2802615 RepID=A0A934WY98_9BACT|nr:cystathionine beta-synthase [Marivirga aurantiaca]MBK6265388.1 cystathionine beta-synthase [Marivirga aurantiaca]